MSIDRPSVPPRQIAREARERFVQAIENLVAPVTRALHERLITLTGEPGTARDLQDRRDDFLAFQAQGEQWADATRAAWRKALASSGAAAPSNSMLRLELIGDDVVETQILSSRLAQAIQGKANFDFSDLRLRIQHLEGTLELDSRDVLRPETLAKVWVEQWLIAGLSRALWTKLQDIVQREVLEPVADAYRDANVFLVDLGVMPEIDLKSFVRRPTNATSGIMPLPSSPARGAEVQGRMSAPGPAGGAYLPPGAAAVMSGLAGGDGIAHPGGASPLVAARQRAQGVLQNLKRFVAARIGGEGGGLGAPGFGPGGDNGGPGSISARAFAAAIADAGAAYQASASHYAVGNDALAVQQSATELRRRTSELKRRAPTTADKATVEVVALMFQAILSEERIPFSARVWFARLQMPVLRVAIAEPEFFGTIQHPARMLIDRMGSVVMGFDAAAISGSALEGEIRRVVQVIEQYPETGQRVFRLVFDEFVVFLNKYLTQSDATQRVMSVAQQVEQKETMAIQYTIELRKMLNDMPVREDIREFLFKVWAEVLAIAALKYGVQDTQTVTLKRAASELVWAASAKPSRPDRARVIQDLPRLLQQLRVGMTLLGVVGEPQEAHIKAIGATLTDAFMSKTEAIPAAQIEALAKRLAHLEDFVSDEGTGELALDAASIELLLGVDAATIDVAPDTSIKATEDMLQWARELQIGHWFMLDHNGRASQVQFVWRSERGQLHLFASADGRSFLIQTGRLGSYLQTGLLVPAEDEALTVRATREALAKLDAHPESLLN
ncbi:MAG TPA: DUF1631 family protein [Variovorax sp.]|nr:DUF1631 family protein [Variovorax sp.]